MDDLRASLRDAADAGRPVSTDIALLRRRANRLRRRRAMAMAAAAVVALTGAGWMLSTVFVEDGTRVDFAQPPPVDAGDPGAQPREWTPVAIRGIPGPSYTRLVDIGDNKVAYIAGADHNANRLKLAIVDLASNHVVKAPPKLSWRAGYGAAWTGDEVLIVGGNSNRGMLRDGGAYNPTTNTWRDLPHVPGKESLDGGSAVWMDGALWFWDAGVRFNAVRDRWERFKRAPLTPRQRSAVATNGSIMFVWGGCDSSRPQCDDDSAGDDELRDGAFYRRSDERWNPLPQAPLTARDRPAATWTGREFIVWGGHPQRGDSDAYGAAWNPETGQWREIAAAPLKERSNHLLLRLGPRVLAWGGVSYTNGGLQDGALYDPVSDSWSEVLRLREVGSRYPQAIAIDGGVAIAGEGDATIWLGTEWSRE